MNGMWSITGSDRFAGLSNTSASLAESTATGAATVSLRR